MHRGRLAERIHSFIFQAKEKIKRIEKRAREGHGHTARLTF
jgi:hypothetical protein